LAKTKCPLSAQNIRSEYDSLVKRDLTNCFEIYDLREGNYIKRVKVWYGLPKLIICTTHSEMLA
jgi:hypothetical protein